jgi:predicted amidohydrolase
MNKNEIKVAALQVKTMPGTSREDKVAHILTLIEKASQDGCQIILPPELCTTDYEKFYTKDPEYFELAEPVPGQRPTRSVS